jgi:DNA-binding winged helix-turn-helix (wHTH) protein
MKFLFDNHALDTDRRELHRGSERIAVEPQVFDLLVYLVQNCDRVVSKDDLIASVWHGRTAGRRPRTVARGLAVTRPASHRRASLHQQGR